MSDVPMDPIEPTPVTPVSGEAVAERYVEKELVESRASLKRTMVVSIVLSLFVVGYMAYLTSGFRANLEPKGAATVVVGMASQRLDDAEPQFAEYVRQQVPEMIRQVPDQVKQELPKYREEIETRVTTALQQQAEQGASKLNQQLDEFLNAHKDEVGALLKNADDQATMDKFATELEAKFQEFLNGTQIGNESIQQKLDETLKALKQVSERTAKLAANKGLTPSEKNARKAVAMLMRRIDAAKAAEPDAIKPVDPDALKKGVNQALENVKGAVDQAKEHVQANMPEGATSSSSSDESKAPSAGNKADAKGSAPATTTGTAAPQPPVKKP